MTTGRINQVASRKESVRAGLESRFVVAPTPEGGRGSRGNGGTSVQSPLQRETVVAFVSGSALTTSPAASTPRGLHTLNREISCVGRTGR